MDILVFVKKHDLTFESNKNMLTRTMAPTHSTTRWKLNLWRNILRCNGQPIGDGLRQGFSHFCWSWLRWRMVAHIQSLLITFQNFTELTVNLDLLLLWCVLNKKTSIFFFFFFEQIYNSSLMTGIQQTMIEKCTTNEVKYDYHKWIIIRLSMWI